MKTCLKVARLNHRNFPILTDCLMFDADTVYSTDLKVYCFEHGNWYFDTPTLVDIAQLNTAMALAKPTKQVWEGDTLNGIKLTPHPSFLVSDYPFAPKFYGQELDFCGADIGAIIDRLTPAMASKDVRYCLNGLCFSLSDNAIISTDGHRLHVQQSAFLIDNPILNELNKEVKEIIIKREVFDLVTPTKIIVNATHSRITHKSGYIIQSHIDSRFPNWKRVMPDTAGRTEKRFNGAQIDALGKIVAINKAIKSKYGACLLSQDGNVSVNNISLPFFNSLPIDFRVNAGYLLDAMKSAESGYIYFADANSSALLVNGNFSAVVMPTRI